MEKLYFEDLAVGFKVVSEPLPVTAAEIVAFATKFDPQPFHLDDAAARQTLFGGLAASGWHTAAMTMRLLVSGGPPFVGGSVGLGVEDLKWPTPVRPGDTLHIVSEIIEVRPSRSKPEQGLVRVRTTTLNQDDVVVQSMVATLIVPRRRSVPPG